MRVIDEVRSFFHKNHVIDLTDSEAKVENMLPRKGNVKNGGEEPISSSEIRTSASEKIGTSKKRITELLRSLNDKDVVEKPGRSTWVSTGRTRTKVDENRVVGMLLTLMFVVMLSALVLNNTALGFMAFVFAFLTIIFRWSP